MRLTKDTTKYFEQDPDYVIDYLASRGVVNESYNRFLRKFTFGILDDLRFFVDGEPYEITHLLGKSKVAGYDIVAANKNLGLSEGEEIAIALVLGDDAICYNTVKKNVCLNFIQNDEGEQIVIDESLETFIKRFDNKEEKK